MPDLMIKVTDRIRPVKLRMGGAVTVPLTGTCKNCEKPCPEDTQTCKTCLDVDSGRYEKVFGEPS